jgi:hypothetical protein
MEDAAMDHNDERSWEGEGDQLWKTGGGWEPADSETWRGDVHVNDWPESLAGPEYWLYKQDNEDE